MYVPNVLCKKISKNHSNNFSILTKFKIPFKVILLFIYRFECERYNLSTDPNWYSLTTLKMFNPIGTHSNRYNEKTDTNKSVRYNLLFILNDDADCCGLCLCVRVVVVSQSWRCTRRSWSVRRRGATVEDTSAQTGAPTAACPGARGLHSARLPKDTTTRPDHLHTRRQVPYDHTTHLSCAHPPELRVLVCVVVGTLLWDVSGV